MTKVANEPTGDLDPGTICQWWALCTREATKTMPHPFLGAVPICDQCAEKVARLS